MARVLLNICSGFRPSSGHVLLRVNSLTSVVLGLVVARVLLNACSGFRPSRGQFY